jgi:predicted nucleic acid-binding Zn ribbon protein
MHCPQCGQQQVGDDVKFCSRCGFLLTGVSEVIRQGGSLPQYQQQIAMPSEPSPKKKGVKQAAMMLMLATVLLPIMGVLNNYLDFPPEVLIALTAVIGYIGGFLRLLFALIFEEGAPKIVYVPTHPQQIHAAYQPPTQQPIGTSYTGTALPPMQSQPVSSWRQANTSEIVQPPSVTEPTTRLLPKEKLPEE